jgi:hypothetical protein
MEAIRLTFGTKGHVNFSVSSVQNNYDSSNLLPIAMEENGPNSYNINIFGAENLESVFPVFKVTETSFFKFEHNAKISSCIRVKPPGQISSFPIEDTVYGLEILNKQKQNLFEKCGGHNQKNLTVWFGVDEGEDVCGIYCTPRKYRTQTDGCSDQVDGYMPKAATVALNNTSTEKYKSAYFQEPRTMNKRTFNFCFQQPKKMMDNLYLN